MSFIKGFHQVVSPDFYQRVSSRDFIKRVYQGFHLGILSKVSSKGSTRILSRDFTRVFSKGVSSRVIMVSLNSNRIIVTRSDDHRNHMLVSLEGVETNHQGLIKGFHQGFVKRFLSRSYHQGFHQKLYQGFHQDFCKGFY